MTDLHNFNAGRKSWQIYTNKLTSISGDDLTLIPYDGKNLILEASGNGNILFKEDGITYNLSDLSNVASSSSSLPSQSNNSGKLLTTDGTNTSWTNIIYCDEIYCNKIISREDDNCYIVFQDINSGDDNYEIWMHSNGAINHNSATDRANGETMIRGKGSIVHSDDRLKHNERDISNSLNIIKKLNPYTYDMTNKFYDASYVGDISDTHYYRAGFIAQEIRQIEEISFCCIGEEYDSSNNPLPLGIDYNSLFTYGIASIQELNILIETQQTEIELLKQENELIKSKLNELLIIANKETI